MARKGQDIELKPKKLTIDEIELLDVEIPGAIYENTTYSGRIETKYFIYSSGGHGINSIALAHRIPFADRYYMSIDENNHIHCICKENATAVQRKLCEELDAKGTL